LNKKATVPLISSWTRDLIYFPIYAPWTVDTWNDAILPESLANTAHHWMANGRMQNVDVQHDGIKTDAAIVESFLSIPEDPRFPVPGTWAGAMQLYDEGLIAGVEMGIINGVSLEIEADSSRQAGYAVTRTKLPTLVQNPVSATGQTGLPFAQGVEAHTHSLDLSFTSLTDIIPTYTSEDVGHRHGVVLGTATEIADGHTHPIDFFKLAVQYESKLLLVNWMSELSVIAISLVEHGANWMPIVSMKRAQEVCNWPDK
jgi:hypothetical protein